MDVNLESRRHESIIILVSFLFLHLFSKCRKTKTFQQLFPDAFFGSFQVGTKNSFLPPAGIKWFGSLSNLSARRSSLKVGGTTKDETPKVAEKPVVASQWVDDLEPRLHGPGYAQSGEMYTHVGTVPRSQRQKKSCKGMKEKKKKDEEEGEGEEEEGVRQGDRVQPSLLLSAMSSLSLTSVARPLPATPLPSWASPLTPATPDPQAETLSKGRDASEAVSQSQRDDQKEKARGQQTPSSQDLYVPMDPITEVALRGQRCVSNKPDTSRSTTCLQAKHR